MSYLWLNKYKPTKFDDFINLNKEIRTIRKWLKCFHARKGTKDFKNCLLLSGATGVGKTVLIETLLREENYNTLHFDASTNSSCSTIEHKINTAMGNNNILSYMSGIDRTAILIDELDVIDSRREFGSSKILEFLTYEQRIFYKGKNISQPKKKFIINKVPIICISNGKHTKKLKTNSLFISILPPSDNDLTVLINRIMVCENFTLNQSIVQLLVSVSQNDYRRTITLLEGIYRYKCNNDDNPALLIKHILSISKKDVNQTIYGDLKDVYTTVKTFKELNDSYYCHNKNLVFLAHENFIRVVMTCFKGNYKTKLKICVKFYMDFLNANVFLEKMFNYWDLQKYISISLSSINNLCQIHKIKSKSTPPFTHSLIASKYNYRFYNLKYINSLSKKLNVDINQFYIVAHILYEVLFGVSNKKTLLKYIDLYRKHDMNGTEFLKIIKLGLLPNNINIAKKIDIKIKRLFDSPPILEELNVS